MTSKCWARRIVLAVFIAGTFCPTVLLLLSEANAQQSKSGSTSPSVQASGAPVKQTPMAQSEPLPYFPVPDAKSDPAVKAAIFAKEDISKSEDKVQRTLDDIKARVDRLKPGLQSADLEKGAIDGFKKIVPLLRQQALGLLGKKTELMGDLQILSTNLERAPRAFLNAAESFEMRGEKAQALKIKEAYAQMAAASKKWAIAIESQKTETDDLTTTMNTKFALLEETLVFLDDFENFLQVFPDQERKVQIKAFLDGMDGYFDNFTETLTQVRRLTNRATEPMPNASPANQTPGKGKQSD